ncbi:uncharacterized protein LOC134822773 isoform X2 [Bolinopsis microptera]|uniref:uncharacterized protein LOC134822773 isoform X2 n=1 Tax=Bolinopsis microptera TaxID=2820187 RepID=UPI00307AF946
MSMSCKSWTYPETQALLDIWQQEHIQTQLTLMARNRPVWEQVAEIMKYRKGFNRTGEQCKTRIHTLKIRYNRAKKFGLSGPEAEKECPFYRQLDAVLGKNWIKKQELDHNSPPSSTSNYTNSPITSLYPLTFANDIDRLSHSGMIQILPKPIPKYVDTAFSKVGGPGLKLPSEKLEDMMGEHNMLIKRMLSSLTGKVADQQQFLKESDQAGFEELIKSLITSPSTTGPAQPPRSIKADLSNPTSPLTPSTTEPDEATSHVTTPTSQVTTPTFSEELPASKRRKVAVSESDEKLVMLGSIAQIINNVSELNKNIKMSQGQEDLKMRWWMEMQEKRFDLEKEHFKTMEGLFSNLISYFTNADVKSVSDSLCSEPTAQE